MSLYYTLLQNAEPPQPTEGYNGVWVTYAGSVLSSGITLAGVILSGGEVLTVSSGGFASTCALHGPGTSGTVSGGGIATNLIVSGTLSVLSGGTVSSADIRPFATLEVHSGGAAVNVISRTGAVINVSSGGSITYAVD